MAIRQRITKTVTEHFDDTEINDQIGTRAPTQSPATLQDIKSNPTKSTGEREEDGSNDQSPISPQQSSSNRDLDIFTAQLKLWLGHHFMKIAGATIFVVGPLIGGVWLASSRYSTITTELKALRNSISAIESESKDHRDRILRLELGSKSPSHQSRSPASPEGAKK